MAEDIDNTGDKNNNPQLPPEFDYLSEDIGKAQANLRALDEQIENVRDPNRPGPALRPPGYGSPHLPGAGENQVNNLNAQKEAVKSGLNSKVEKEIAAADPKTAAKVREAVSHKTTDGNYKQPEPKSKDSMEGFNKSQDAFNARFSDKHLFQKNTQDVTGQKTEQPEKSQQPASAPKTQPDRNNSAANRYSLSLNYTQEVQQAEPQAKDGKDQAGKSEKPNDKSEPDNKPTQKDQDSKNQDSKETNNKEPESNSNPQSKSTPDYYSKSLNYTVEVDNAGGGGGSGSAGKSPEPAKPGPNIDKD